MRLWPAFALLVACGRGSGTAAAPAREDGGAAALGVVSEARVRAAPLDLGLPSISAFGYRKGPGQPAFGRAREAEAVGRWTAVAAACREALAADPAHLDAAYLLAVALAKTGAAPAEILAPLTLAVAGDFVKWGAAALAQPALQPFLATPLGTTWDARVAEARARHATILARSLVVGARGDYYAYDREAARFHRLTRTGGAVVAMFRTPKVAKLVYVTRARRNGETKIGIGLVNLATSRSKKLVHLGTPGDSIRVAYSTKRSRFVVLAKTWFGIDDDGEALQLQAVPPGEQAAIVAGLADKTWLDVKGRRAELVRMQLPNIAADVDTHHLASALKIQSSKHVVTVPSPGLIDTSTVAWSPDRSQVAFVALRSDVCRGGEPDTAVFVADMASGTAREIERAVSAMAFDWVADRTLAIVGDHGVAIHTVTGDPPTAIEGGDALAYPKRRPACAAETTPVDEVAVEADEDL